MASNDTSAAFGHQAGQALYCLTHAITVHKEATCDGTMRVGFSIGGGIDMDHKAAPHPYPDRVRRENVVC